MNEEIKEALRHFQEAVDAKKGIIKFDYTIAIKDVELLLSYIEQLENNRDKAIEYINNWLDGKNNDDIIIIMNNLGNILKGDSDE